MSAGIYWFRMVKGEDFNRSLTWFDGSGSPVDLSGYSAEFNVDLNNSALISVASPANITLGGSAGTVQVFIPATMFAGVQDFSEASYRLLLTPPSGGPTCLLTGQFTNEGETG